MMIDTTIGIYGAGGTGREYSDIIEDNSTDIDFFFIDDNSEKDTLKNKKIVRFGNLDNSDKHSIVIAVGEPFAREVLLEAVDKANFNLISIVSKRTYISSDSCIGRGCVIYPGSRISSKAILHENVLVQFNSVIGHDVIVGPNSVVSSGVALGGGVVIEDNCFIGMGAVIKEGVRVGSGSIVGMGAVVYKDIGSQLIVIGNPARPALRNTNQKVF